MNAAIVLLTALASTLVLRSGERIVIDGAVNYQNGRVLFRSVGGTLYSLPAQEIDQEATRTADLTLEASPVVETPSPEASPLATVKLRVSSEERDRRLRELEKNHSGTPAAPQKILEAPPPPPTDAELAARKEAEWSWRRQARQYEEGVRRAQESLDLLRVRAERLQAEIRGLLSLGFRPHQFTYQTTVLETIYQQLPYAELEVARAQRAYDQFRDDARRLGVLPGWLR
jgi:hypothetical protein